MSRVLKGRGISIPEIPEPVGDCCACSGGTGVEERYFTAIHLKVEFGEQFTRFGLGAGFNFYGNTNLILTLYTCRVHSNNG